MPECSQALEQDAVRDAAPAYRMNSQEFAQDDVPPGYKQTEVGVIPEEWDTGRLGDFYEIRSSKRVFQSDWRSYGIPFYRTREVAVLADKGAVDNELYISEDLYSTYAHKYGAPKPGDALVTGIGTVGKLYVVPDESKFYFKDASIIWLKSRHRFEPAYLKQLFETELIRSQIADSSTGTTVETYTISGANRTLVSVPPVAEQRAIATALADADALIESLDRLIAKKRTIKQATMQQLLTGQTRLPGFTGEWEAKRLENIADCLDGLRVPLNETQRARMPGPYPYCGANGVLDHVNDYVLDDDVILIAEDGGHFDEYSYRPIAYRMAGKIWVNNHAHILKSKPEISQDFLYFSLVHKNILPYLASGTRAKLNKSEMNKIQIYLPREKREQAAVGAILSDIEAEIRGLERRRDKARQIKQGMMQQLLTGQVRLVEAESVRS